MTLTPEAQLERSYRAGWTPPSRMSVVEWADRFRYICAQEGGGKWYTETVEAGRGPMLAVTEPGVRVLTAMVCTQMLKTSLLLNVFGYLAHLDPCPILLVQPKDEAATAFSKERIGPTIRATPALRKLIGQRKTRDDSQTNDFKPFPGGYLAIVGALSSANLASRPVRAVLYDEVDKYEALPDGDAIEIGDARMARYDDNSLSVRVCSPTDEGRSRIETSFGESDQRRASIACPCINQDTGEICNHRLFPDFFRHVEWNKIRRADGTIVEHQPETAAIHCEACGGRWSEGDRIRALRSIRWHQTRPFDCCGQRWNPTDLYEAAWRAGAPDPIGAAWDWWEDTKERRYAVYRARCPDCGTWKVSNKHAGFQASKLLSPYQQDRPQDHAAAWLSAQGNDERLRAWWNTRMGLPFRTAAGKTLAIEQLLARRESWAGDVPPGAGVLTASMDTQDFWVELETKAWGLDEESWSIDHTRIDGEFRDPAVQAKVDAYLLRTWRDQQGRPYKVMGACLDSGGHHVQAVYDFSKARLSRCIWAIKGASERDGMRNPIWPTKRPSRRTKASFRPVSIGGNTARDTIRARLTSDPPPPGGRCPGYMHFPADRDVGWFEQLIADRRELQEKGGRKFTVWVTPAGRANEAADLQVYNLAALKGLEHLGLTLNRRVAETREAPVPAPSAADARTPTPMQPEPERKLSITQLEVPKGKSAASRLA